MSIQTARRKPLKRAVHLRSLEQRYMFDGAAAVDATHAAQATHARPDSPLPALIANVTEPAQVRAADPALNNGRLEVVFVDTSVKDYKALEDKLRAGLEVREIGQGEDGLAQVAKWASTHQGYDAAHILSHGSEAQLDLGTAVLNQASLLDTTARTELAQIGRALTPGGDLLLYGCDVAAGADGQRFIRGLADTVHADVAASVNATGAADKGGDWVLESKVGKIDTHALDIAGYRDLLTTVTITTSDANYSSNSFTRSVGGRTFTFSNANNFLGMDTSYGAGTPGLYAYEGMVTGNDIKLTIAVENGYQFDITQFNVGVLTGSLNIQLTYATGSTTSFTQTGLNTSNFSTLSSFSTAIVGVKQVVLSSDDFGLFQNFEIINVHALGPTVTDANVSISGASGTGGAYKIGDTVTATWNNTSGGDNNTGVTGVTMDFSQFGGGSAVAATNSSGTWTATYTILSGAIDNTNRNVSVSATNSVGTITTADTTNATVDNIAPTVTDANISISGASGTGGAYKIGDTVTATWNNTAGGDNNSDTISSVTVDFSQFGGGSTVAATNSSGTWTATYTISAGAINGTANRNVSVTTTDNAGNTTTRADTSNVTVDNVAPTTTIATKAFSSDTGSSSTDFITSGASQTISGTLSANLATGESVLVSLDNGSTWTAATATVGLNTWSLAGQTLSGSNTLKVKVQDGAGNNGAVSSQAYTLDTSAPSAPSTPDMTSGTDSGTSNTDNITNNTTPTFTGTAESGSTVTLYDTDGSTVLGTATATGGNWSITSSSLSAGSHTLTAKATDAAGNTSSASSGLSVTIDTSAPTSLALDTTTIPSANATSSASIATLSATDGLSISYSLAVGNGTNDADNGSFSISGNALQVGGASLTAGTYKIYVAATDAAGNVANQAFTLTVVDAPSISSIVRTGAASATVAGSASSISYTVTFDQAVTGVDASDFALTATGTASGSIASVSGSGTTYTVTVNTLAGDGTLRLDLNNSGTGIQNGSSVAILSGYTSGSTYTLDHTAPNAPSTPDLATGSDSGSSSSDNITSASTPTFTGTAESGSTVTLYDTDGSTVLGTATATGGNWSITSSSLSSGSHTLTAKATDAAGNTSSASSGLSVTVDTSAPTSLALDSTTIPSANATSSASIATLSATDGLSISYSLAVGNGTNDADNGSFSISGNALQVGGASLTAGTYKIYVAATDAAGNVANQAFTLTVVDAPSVSSIVRAGAASATVAGSASSISYTVTFDQAVTGVDASDFALTATGTASGSIASVSGSGTTYTVTVNTLAGDGTLRLDLNNSGTGIQNGNSVAILSGYTSGSTYTLDHTAPNAPSTPDLATGSDSGSSSSDNITSASTPTFTGTAESGSTVTLYDTDGSSVLGTATATGGNWSITSSTLSSGSHTLTAKASDAAGNVSTASSGLSVTIDTTAPTVSSVSVPGNGLHKAGDTLSFTINTSEAVTVDTSGGTPRLALDVGGTTVYASYASGSGSSALVFSYTVQAGDTDTDGITVGTLQANGGTLTDTAGNSMTLTLNSVGSTSNVLIDTTAPTIASVSVPSNGTYVDGSTLDFTVQFDEAVSVDTTGGTPRIALTIGSSTVYASYLSGSGSSSLVFRYTVQAGQQDVDGITVGSLTLNGGTLQDAATNGATLTLNSVGSTASVMVNGLQPSITDVSASTANGSYKAGDTITITVDFSKAVTVDTTGGTPTLTLDDGGTATYTSGSGSSTLTFTHVIADGNNSADLDYSTTSALVLNGGGITDAGGTHQNAALTLATPGATHSLGANKGIVIDTTPPAISFSNLAFSADTGTSSSDFITRTAAQTITATLSGAPAGGDIVYGSLDNGATWTDITSKVSGTTLSWDGVTLAGSNTLKLKVSDSVGNDGTVASQAYVLDTTAPSITFSNLALSADTGVSSSDFITHTAAQTITATLSSAPAGSDIVYGSLDNGATWTDITSKVSGTTLSWDGVTLAGSNTLRLKVSDAAGNDGSATSQAYVLDTTAPTITVSGITLSNDSGASASDFITNVASQTISATLSAAPAGSDVVWGSLDNGATWVNITAKVSGTSLQWDGVTLTSSSAIRIKVSDAAGNDGPVASQAYTFDNTAPTLPTFNNLSTTSTTPTLSGSASLGAGEAMTITVEGGATYNVAPSGGLWQLDLATATPVSGTLALTVGRTFVVTVAVTDTAGNSATATGALNVAAPTPVIPTQPEPVAPPPPPAPTVVETPAAPPVVERPSTFLSPATQAAILPTGSPDAIAPRGAIVLPTVTAPSPVGLEAPAPAAAPVLTRGGEGLFQITVMPQRAGAPDSLLVNRPIPDQVLPSTGRIAFSVPADTFAQTNPDARVQLSATQANGQPLPSWLRFNPQTGRFEGTPPPGVRGELAIRLIARDAQGHEAASVFKVRMGGASRGAQSSPPDAGRPSLSEQIRLAAQRQARHTTHG